MLASLGRTFRAGTRWQQGATGAAAALLGGAAALSGATDLCRGPAAAAAAAANGHVPDGSVANGHASPLPSGVSDAGSGGPTAAAVAVGAAAAAAAAAAGVWYLRQAATTPPAAPTSSTGEHYLIDCGSGWSRVQKFTIHADGKVHVDDANAGRLPAVDRAIAAGAQGQQAWLEALAAEVDSSTPILIGATAGVRDALAQGKLDSAALAAFSGRVRETFGARAQFRVVSGEEEASSELAAVRYCISAMPGVTAGSGGGSGVPGFGGLNAGVDESTVALISSGGMSSQMVFGQAPVRAISLRKPAHAVMRRCRRVGWLPSLVSMRWLGVLRRSNQDQGGERVVPEGGCGCRLGCLSAPVGRPAVSGAIPHLVLRVRVEITGSTIVRTD
jgi:hypothetical protein